MGLTLKCRTSTCRTEREKRENPSCITFHSIGKANTYSVRTFHVEAGDHIVALNIVEETGEDQVEFARDG